MNPHPSSSINVNPYKTVAFKAPDEGFTSLDQALSTVGGNIPMDRIALAFMVGSGMRRHHKLLDIGCGCCRIGHLFIDYLNEGNYYGMDGRPEIIDAALKFVLTPELIAKKPSFEASWNFEFEKFHEDSFDYMFAQSVISHVPESEVRLLFRKVDENLAANGKAFITFIEGPRNDQDCYRWEQSDLKSFMDGTSLRFEYIGDWGHMRTQRMFKLSKR